MIGFEAVLVTDVQPGDTVRVRGVEWPVTRNVRISSYMVALEGHPLYGRQYIADCLRVFTRRKEA